MSKKIPTWQDRIAEDNRPYDYSEKYGAEEVAYLRAALKQTEDNAADISAHLAAMTETARKYRALAQKEAAAPGDPGPTCVYCAVAIDGSASGDLYAAIIALPLPIQTPIGGIPHYGYTYKQMVEFRHAAARIARAALAQPVAVDASQGWISVQDRLPEIGVGVLVYSPPTKHDWPNQLNIAFDCIDPDGGGDTWLNHNEHYDHFCCAAKPEGSSGPSADAPYTHWMPLPAAPVAAIDAQDGEA